MDFSKTDRFTTDLTRHLTLLNRSQETIRGYENEVRKYLIHFNRDPKTVTVNEGIDYLNTLKPHARKTAIAALKFFYSHCLKSDKFADVGYPKLPEYTPEILSEDEVKSLIDVATNVKHRTAIMLLYTTGIRVMELINLTWDCVDKKTMRIYIRQGKGKKDRQVKLTESMLRQFILYCKALDLRCFNGKDFIFKGKSKTKDCYSKRSVAAFLERYALEAGIKKKVTPHLLRHAFGTHQLERGTDSLKIKKMMGHNSLRTTETYTKSANVTNDVADLMENR